MSLTVDSQWKLTFRLHADVSGLIILAAFSVLVSKRSWSRRSRESFTSIFVWASCTSSECRGACSRNSFHVFVIIANLRSSVSRKAKAVEKLLSFHPNPPVKLSSFGLRSGRKQFAIVECEFLRRHSRARCRFLRSNFQQPKTSLHLSSMFCLFFLFFFFFLFITKLFLLLFVSFLVAARENFYVFHRQRSKSNWCDAMLWVYHRSFGWRKKRQSVWTGEKRNTRRLVNSKHFFFLNLHFFS